jgi:hypothetical protein
MFISSLFLGRGFCGWICPGAGCQEAIFLARSKEVTQGDYIKWLIWVPWISSIVMLAIRSDGRRTKTGNLYNTNMNIEDVNCEYDILDFSF